MSAEQRKGRGEGREKNEASQHEREKRRKSYRQLANKTRTNRPVGRTFTDYSSCAHVERFPSGDTPACLSTSSLAPAFLWEKELGESFWVLPWGCAACREGASSCVLSCAVSLVGPTLCSCSSAW